MRDKENERKNRGGRRRDDTFDRSWKAGVCEKKQKKNKKKNMPYDVQGSPSGWVFDLIFQGRRKSNVVNIGVPMMCTW